MDKHPQNWFYWLNDYAPAVGLIVTGAFAVIGAGWALFTWQKSKAGSDQKTIGHLNNLLDRFGADLDQRDIELADKEALIAQLKATLELAQKIAAGGDDKLASRARALLADLGSGSLGAALLPNLRALIQDYEQGPIKDLVQLHMGEGALTFHGDPQASLAAYRRAHALDPENIVAINSIGLLELLFGSLKAAEDAFRQVLDLGRFQEDQRAIAVGYANLGVIAMARGDWEVAVDYFTQDLASDEELGRKEGMAQIYANLGAVAFKRGDLLEARQFWVQARGLYAEMGVQPKVAQIDQWLANLEPPAGP
ncbi:hypothetical protein N9E07_07440 [Planktomarina temperata]|nr:hypothetical protein [Planktomarina temperata]